MTRDQLAVEIYIALTEQGLDEAWAKAEALGYSREGLLYRDVLTRRAELRGEPKPTFETPPGAALPPITGTFGME